MSIVVRCSAAARCAPSARSTSAALVNVEPKSTQTTRSRPPAQPPGEGTVEVGDQVVGGLDADAEPDQVGGHLELGAGHARRASSGPGARSATRRRRATRPSVNTSARRTGVERRPARRRRRRNDTMPPNRFICRAATAWPGCSGEAGVDRPATTCGWPVEELDDPLGVVAVPVHPHRRASSGRAGSARQSNGPAHRAHGVLVEGDLSRRGRGRGPRARRRPRRSARRTYFVVECTTTSAPRVSGCWRYGEAKVLSTTSSAPASWATAASASMSPMLSSGLVGVSTQTSLVSPGPDRGAHRVDVGDRRRRCARGPSGCSTLSNSRKVPPYASSGITTWSPGRHSAAQQGVLGGQAAGEREARARPPRAPRALPSRAVRVGLARAAVLVAAAQPADAVLLVGAGRVDRRDHRAGRRVGLVAGVDRARLEAGLAAVLLGHASSYACEAGPGHASPPGTDRGRPRVLQTVRTPSRPTAKE